MKDIVWHLATEARAATPLGQQGRVFPMAKCVLWGCAGKLGVPGGGGGGMGPTS